MLQAPEAFRQHLEGLTIPLRYLEHNSRRLRIFDRPARSFDHPALLAHSCDQGFLLLRQVNA
jgi:hypothetical protein